jgi:hypothetical protein
MQNPTVKVLSTLTANRVEHLLMGGQACVFYGAAQFSRDADIAVLAESANLGRLQAALDDLQAEVVAVPPFEQQYLDFGLAVHFRCRRTDLHSIRVDVMSRMRGVDPFPVLFGRRHTIQLDDGQPINLMNVADLVLAKKTQRDKDWPMIRALVDAHYEQHRDSPNEEQVEFWLREGRSPQVLIDLSQTYPAITARIATQRPLLQHAVSGSGTELSAALTDEQCQEQQRDRQYWEPLRAKLQELRINRPRDRT